MADRRSVERFRKDTPIFHSLKVGAVTGRAPGAFVGAQGDWGNVDRAQHLERRWHTLGVAKPQVLKKMAKCNDRSARYRAAVRVATAPIPA